MIYFNKSKREERRKAFRRFAYGIDGDFSAKDEYGQINYFRDFALFRQGSNRKITNLVKKIELRREINVFDYRYIIHAGNTHMPIHQTVFFVKSDQLAIPQFLLRPENFFHRIGQLLGMQDIDFEKFPDFSHQYLLKGENENLIRSQFNHSLLNFFSVSKGWYLEGLNYYLILYKKNKLLKPDDILNLYQKGLFLYDQFVSESQ